MSDASTLDPLSFDPHPFVYPPSEDTELLARCAGAEVLPGERVAEIGCGHALAAIACARAGARALASDVSPHAAAAARRNAARNRVALNVVRGSLLSFSRFRFDLVLFNPPYLPSDDTNPLGTGESEVDGGKTGAELLSEFIRDLPAHLAPRGRAIVIVSSRTGDAWRDAAADSGLALLPVSRRPLPLEKLTAIRLVPRGHR